MVTLTCIPVQCQVFPCPPPAYSFPQAHSSVVQLCPWPCAPVLGQHPPSSKPFQFPVKGQVHILLSSQYSESIWIIWSRHGSDISAPDWTILSIQVPKSLNHQMLRYLLMCALTFIFPLWRGMLFSYRLDHIHNQQCSWSLCSGDWHNNASAASNWSIMKDSVQNRG